jgi:hypothetical protein
MFVIPDPCSSQMSQTLRRASVDAHRVEVSYIGIFLRHVAVTADDPAAVPEHAHDAAVLPVPDLLVVGLLQQTQEISGRRTFLRGHLDFCDEARPGTLFQLVELRRFWKIVRHGVSLLY